MTKIGWLPYQGAVSRPIAPLTKRHRREYPERDLVHLPLMKMCRKHPILGGLRFFHVENERKTQTYAQGAIRKAMGVKRGVSDLILLHPARGYHGACIELKAPGNKPTDMQAQFLEEIALAGYCAIWFDSAQKAYEFLIWYVGESDEKQD